MSRALEGIDPSLVLTGGKSDDYPGFSTLNYAEILISPAPHDPNQDHIGHPGAWSADPSKDILAPELVNELNGLDLV